MTEVTITLTDDLATWLYNILSYIENDQDIEQTSRDERKAKAILDLMDAFKSVKGGLPE